MRSNFARLLAEIQILFLVGRKQRKHPIDMRSFPAGDVVLEPLAPARTGTYGQPAGPRFVKPIEFLSHLLVLALHNDIPRKTVNIHASLTQNVDALMSIQYSSIRPGFQTVW